MKTMKRVSALIMALMLVLSLAAPVMAADNTYTLTVHNKNDGHTYEAYQIFAGTLAEKDGKMYLSDIEWGTGVNGDAVLAAIKAEDGLAVLHEATDAATLAEKVSGLTTDSESVDLFAEVVGGHLATPSGKCTDKGDYYEITGLDAGYYLVKDKDNTLDGVEGEAYTKFIIRVLKDESVNPKSSVPGVSKSINDTLVGDYGKYEDFDINDTVYYKWVGTLPSNLNAYDTYFYQFVDTLPSGIAYMQFQQVYVEGHDGNLVHTFYDITDDKTDNDTMPAGMTQSIEGTTLKLTIDDLLSLYENILPSHSIVVKYTARVTRDALVADSMTNTVKLIYSNNPNGEGSGNTGVTPEDVAHAFTFQINVDKYDADNKDAKLEGAEFVLYYERIEKNDAGEETTVKHYAQVVTEEMVYVLDENGKPTAELRPEDERLINGSPVDANDIGVVRGWTTDKTQASVLVTDENGALNVRGLDSGIYYLEETKAPAGYNLMETRVMVEIIPTYTEETKNVSVSVSYKVDSIPQESDTVGVRNSSGSTLPSTGGMGTTLFYVFGSVMVLAAIVLLVTKKRMGTEA